MIHCHPEVLCNLAITLFQVVPAMDQLLIAARHLRQCSLDNSPAVGPSRRVLHCQRGALRPLFFRDASATLTPIVSRQIAGHCSQIGTQASRSPPWPQPSISVFPDVEHEALIELVHFRRAQLRMTAEDCPDEPAICRYKLIQCVSIASHQTCNKAALFFEFHRGIQCNGCAVRRNESNGRTDGIKPAGSRMSQSSS